MKNEKTYNTYVSITLYITPTRKYARIYNSIESCKLEQHLEVEYRSGKQELAKLMLRTMTMPHIRHDDDGWSFYSLHGFLD